MTLRGNDEKYSSDDKGQVYFDIARISAVTAIAKHLPKPVDTDYVPLGWLKLVHKSLPHRVDLISLRWQGVIIHIRMAIHRVLLGI